MSTVLQIELNLPHQLITDLPLVLSGTKTEEYDITSGLSDDLPTKSDKIEVNYAEQLRVA